MLARVGLDFPSPLGLWLAALGPAVRSRPRRLPARRPRPARCGLDARAVAEVHVGEVVASVEVVAQSVVAVAARGAVELKSERLARARMRKWSNSQIHLIYSNLSSLLFGSAPLKCNVSCSSSCKIQLGHFTSTHLSILFCTVFSYCCRCKRRT